MKRNTDIRISPEKSQTAHYSAPRNSAPKRATCRSLQGGPKTNHRQSIKKIALTPANEIRFLCQSEVSTYHYNFMCW